MGDPCLLKGVCTLRGFAGHGYFILVHILLYEVIELKDF